MTRGKCASLVVCIALLVGVPAVAEAAVRQTCAVAAHRGDWSSTHTENGLPAMRRAVASGADYLETDLRVTKDEKFVLMHDARVDRTTRGTGLVSRKTLRQVTQAPLNDGSQVPTLHQLLTMVKPSGVHLLIELKGMGDLSTYTRLAAKLREFGQDRVRVMSFSTARLDTLEGVSPAIPQGILTNTLLPPAEVAPYDSVMVNFQTMTVEWLDSMPYPVYAWTLNDEERWRESHAHRLAGVITDAPSLFIPWRVTGCAEPALAPEQVAG